MSSKKRKPARPAAKPGANSGVIRAVTPALTPAPAKTPGTQMELKPSRQVSRDEIARAAYFLWLERGGNATVNWLEAEARLAGAVKKA